MENPDKTPVVAEEVARSDLDRFYDANEIDVDQKHMTPDEVADFQAMERKLLKQIMFGRLTIDADGQATYTPYRSKNLEPIVFHEATGAALMAMDRRKKSEDMAKMYATMGEMCRVDAKRFAQMHIIDLKICIAITTLFLA